MDLNEVEEYSTIKSGPKSPLRINIKSLEKSNFAHVITPKGTFYVTLPKNDSIVQMDSNTLFSHDSVRFKAFSPGIYTFGFGAASPKSPEKLSLEFAFNLNVR